MTENTVCSSVFITVSPSEVVSRSEGNSSVVNNGRPITIEGLVIITHEGYYPFTLEEIPSSSVLHKVNEAPLNRKRISRRQLRTDTFYLPIIRHF